MVEVPVHAQGESYVVLSHPVLNYSQSICGWRICEFKAPDVLCYELFVEPTVYLVWIIKHTILYCNLFCVHTHTNINPLPSLSLPLKARPISSRGRSTGECLAVTWRWRPVSPALSLKTGSCAPRCSRTLQTRSPKARRREATCTITQTMQRTALRCAPAPQTPPRL